MNKSLSRGFTLIEILAALAIGSMVMLAIAETFYSAVMIEKQNGNKSADDRTASILLNKMSREIISAFRFEDTSVFKSEGNGEKDNITIWTGAYGVPKFVEYEWQSETLLRKEIDTTKLRKNKPIPIRGVTKLGLRFYDNNGWHEDWNGNGIPKGIAIELHIGSKVYGTITTL